MKKTLIAIGFGLCAAGNAQAADAGAYASLGAGLHMANKSNFQYEDPPGTLAGSSNVNFDLGFGVAAAAGYRWTDTIRTELEISYRTASMDNIALEDADGKQSSLSAMANFLIDVGIGTNFYPYIGAGIGIADNRWKGVKTPTSPVFNDADKKMQWQAIIGAELPINARTSWFVDYRFIGSPDNSYNSISPPAARVIGADSQSHNLMVGVRFGFGG